MFSVPLKWFVFWLVSHACQCAGFHFKGQVSFNKRCLHAIGDTPNPYEKAISIIGKTMAPFDEDNLIPCFGFGDGRFSPWKLSSNNVVSSFAPYNSAVELIDLLYLYSHHS